MGRFPPCLAQWLFEEFRVSISKPTLSRELRHMGFRKLSARPRHHAQDEEAAVAFKKTFSPSWRRQPQKRLLASRKRFGFKHNLGAGKKTRPPADGRNAGHGLRRRTTRGRVRPIFSAPSARPKEKAPGSYYPPATVKPWRFIWRKSRLRSRPARTPSFFLIRRDGMSRRGFPSQTTSRSCRCRRNRPSSIRLRTSGNSCATIGSRTASSNPTTTSSTIAASPGISSSTCPGRSCPSGPETGSTGHDHQDLVLHADGTLSQRQLTVKDYLAIDVPGWATRGQAWKNLRKLGEFPEVARATGIPLADIDHAARRGGE